MENTVTLRQGDDFHSHFRDGPRLAIVLWHTIRWFARAMVMPNDPLILNAGQAVAYRQQIMENARMNGYPNFEPLMTMMITPETTPGMVIEARSAGVFAGKVYTPTTNKSERGIRDFRAPQFLSVLETMQVVGMPALFHGEVPLKEEGDENTFLEQEPLFLPIFIELTERFPGLKMTLEHVTTKEAVETVLGLGPHVGATITAHHLTLTVNDLIGPQIYPHNFCRPPAKRLSDREALWKAVHSDSGKFFFGSDTAPHFRQNKECVAGCAGVFTAPVLLPLLAALFEKNCNDQWSVLLERFMSTNGAAFYGLPLNKETMTLVRVPFPVPSDYEGIRPFLAGETQPWSVKTD